jgi:taurine dioxygenase
MTNSSFAAALRPPIVPAPRAGAGAFEIRPFSGGVDAAFGAEVLGLDLAQPLSASSFARLHRAHLDHPVLVFRGQQHLTPAQHAAFSRRWGPLQTHVLRKFALPAHPEVLVVSNIIEGGEPIGLGDAGVFWHSDLSYKARPSLGSLLHALELPASGGDTLFADQHAAWLTLPQALQQMIAGRRAEHSYLKQYEELRRRNPWRPPLTDAQLRDVPPVWHPVVRTHPETGAKALFVSEHFSTRIEGLPEAESDAVLAELCAHATQPQFVLRQRWQPGDLVFWDNRSVQHLATGCPPEQRRRLNRTTIEGDIPA